jgi:hypothetical protein
MIMTPPLILGLDPGPRICGICEYDPRVRRVFSSISDASVEYALQMLDSNPYVVAIERVQATGQIAGNEVLWTAEVSARLYQRALDYGYEAEWLYRREVLRILDVTGAGNRDSLVRARLLEMHGGPEAKGTKRAPGPLYGLSGHGWAALALAVAAAGRRGSG